MENFHLHFVAPIKKTTVLECLIGDFSPKTVLIRLFYLDFITFNSHFGIVVFMLTLF